jgi:hypothetical protein
MVTCVTAGLYILHRVASLLTFFWFSSSLVVKEKGNREGKIVSLKWGLLVIKEVYILEGPKLICPSSPEQILVVSHNLWCGRNWTRESVLHYLSCARVKSVLLQILSVVISFLFFLCGAGNQTQGFEHARQVLHHWAPSRPVVISFKVLTIHGNFGQSHHEGWQSSRNASPFHGRFGW